MIILNNNIEKKFSLVSTETILERLQIVHSKMHYTRVQNIDIAAERPEEGHVGLVPPRRRSPRIRAAPLSDSDDESRREVLEAPRVSPGEVPPDTYKIMKPIQHIGLGITMFCTQSTGLVHVPKNDLNLFNNYY